MTGAGPAVLLATRSAGKLRELRPLLFAALGLAVEGLEEAGLAESPDEAAIEAFETFEANALAKARYFHALSGRSVIADDSGLEVLALHGAPGVRSRRWSMRADLSGQPLDDANNETLLRALERKTDRRARYVCAAAYVGQDWEVVTRGEAEGVILTSPRGKGGFGYDPFFYSLELGCTFAEASREEKERVSHRGRAFRALIAQLSASQRPR